MDMMVAPRSRTTVPHHGPAPRLDVDGDQCQRTQPDATQAEVGVALLAAGGSMLSRTVI